MASQHDSTQDTTMQDTETPQISSQDPLSQMGPLIAPSLLKKDRALKDFLPMMDKYAPIIPDAVTDYYLTQAGFECDDIRIKRLLALAAQKFISDIATDAYQYSRVRQSGSGASATLPQKKYMRGACTFHCIQPTNRMQDSKKTVLTMEDLSGALHEYGVNVKRPEFYR